MKRIKIIMLLSIINSLACSTIPSKEAQQIIEIDDNESKNCTFLENVDGISAFGGWPYTEIGIKRAKNEALDKAVGLGATHILWMSISKSDTGPHVMARAYLCKDGKKKKKI